MNKQHKKWRAWLLRAFVLFVAALLPGGLMLLGAYTAKKKLAERNNNDSDSQEEL